LKGLLFGLGRVPGMALSALKWHYFSQEWHYFSYYVAIKLHATKSRGAENVLTGCND
jgi:hypothetical protein